MDLMAVRYLCAGRLRFSPGMQRLILDPAETSEEEVAVLISDAAARLSRRPEEEDWEFRLRVVRARVGCGTDLTGLIEQLPVDGQEYEVTCPSCGNVATVVRHPEPEVKEA